MKNIKEYNEFKEFLTESSSPHWSEFVGVDDYCIFDDSTKGIDLSDIPEDEIKNAYTNYKVFKNRPHGTALVDCLKEKRLVEGVQKSLDVKEVKSALHDKYWMYNWQIREEQGANGIKVVVICPHIGYNEDMIIDDMFSMGYYHVYTDPFELNGKNWSILRFDPKFTEDITNLVRSYEYIYHLSPKYNLDSIRENGFVPKSNHSRFNYPPRVHFIKGDTSTSDVNKLAYELCDDNKDPRNDGDYVFFTIDTSLIPDGVKFFGDSCLECGICTYDTVPFDAVIESKIFNFKR